MYPSTWCEILHSKRVLEFIRSEINHSGGQITFKRFMELVLYEPELGYYCNKISEKIGIGGDFITAPNLSSIFSICIAKQCKEIIEVIGTKNVVITELGAGTGIMAADILNYLESSNSLPEKYNIIEISKELQIQQKFILKNKLNNKIYERVCWLHNLPENGTQGIIIGNEFFDALPVERFCITENGPRRLEVVWKTGLCIIEGEESESVNQEISKIESHLGFQLPIGYISEYTPQLTEWIRKISSLLQKGVVLIIDYGYSKREYYHPDRIYGTLICHYKHYVHSNPLILTGLQDITASVDFTAIADAASVFGLKVSGYTRQNYFLFSCGILEELSYTEVGTLNYLKKSNQIKLLTLPGEMGERFKVIILDKNFDNKFLGLSMNNEINML